MLFGLVMYALLVLVRNILAGLEGVPEDVREAAPGMGYGRARLLWQVELPLALPAIMAGVRVATVSTVALVTVGVIVGYGRARQLILARLPEQLLPAADRRSATVALRACPRPLVGRPAAGPWRERRAAPPWTRTGARHERARRRLRLAQRPAELDRARRGSST